MPQAIEYNVKAMDLGVRMQSYKTVDASPSAAAETVIATLNLTDFGDMQVLSRVEVRGWAAFTVGGSGVSANLRVRQTDVNGTVVCATGATTVTAAGLYALAVEGWDAAPGIKAYALTLTVGSAAAGSTVSALKLSAVII